MSEIACTTEHFKLITSFNDNNILSVIDSCKQVLYNHDMVYLLDKDEKGETAWDLDAGQHFFQNKWFMKVITHRNHRPWGAHILVDREGNGILAFKKLVESYFPKEKNKRLQQILDSIFRELRLLRLTDVHILFLVVSWITKSMIELGDTKWEQEEYTATQVFLMLNSSSTELHNKETALSMILAKMPEGDDNTKQLQLVKNELYRKYSDHALTKHK